MLSCVEKLMIAVFVNFLKKKIPRTTKKFLSGLPDWHVYPLNNSRIVLWFRVGRGLWKLFASWALTDKDALCSVTPLEGEMSNLYC